MEQKKEHGVSAQGDGPPRAWRERDIVPVPPPSSSDDGPSTGLRASRVEEEVIAADREGLSTQAGSSGLEECVSANLSPIVRVEKMDIEGRRSGSSPRYVNRFSCSRVREELKGLKGDDSVKRSLRVISPNDLSEQALKPIYEIGYILTEYCSSRIKEKDYDGAFEVLYIGYAATAEFRRWLHAAEVRMRQLKRASIWRASGLKLARKKRGASEGDREIKGGCGLSPCFFDILFWTESPGEARQGRYFVRNGGRGSGCQPSPFWFWDSGSLFRSFDRGPGGSPYQEECRGGG